MLDSQNVVDGSGKPDRIVKMRDAFGKMQDWAGDWSDTSSRWTPDLVQTVKGQKKKDSSCFWMNVNDVCRIFSQMCVSRVHPNYVYTSLPASKAPLTERTTARLFSMRVFQKTHGYVAVSQKDARNFLQKAFNKDFALSNYNNNSQTSLTKSKLLP